VLYPRPLLPVLAACVFVAFAAPAYSLSITKPVPQVHIAEWVQPGPVKFFDISAPQPAPFFLIEFWATYCPGCHAISPYLSQLQREYQDKGLAIIAISTEDAERVRAFVRAKGEGMGYAVVVDDQGATQKAYTKAVNAPGIPYAFLTDRQGRLVWHGVPERKALGALVARVASPTFDLAAERRAEKAPKLISRYLRLVRKDQDVSTAAELGAQILQDAAPRPRMLQQFAWDLMTDRAIQHRDLGLALRAAAAACEGIEPADPLVTETYAKALFENKRLREAITLQKEAIAQCRNDLTRRQFERTLAEYEQQANNAG
jgi:thiol-disulfide isomerase/thioredoxin